MQNISAERVIEVGASVIGHKSSQVAEDESVDLRELELVLGSLPLVGDAARYVEELGAELLHGKMPIRPLLFVGPVGVGKSRAAEELAKGRQERFGLVAQETLVDVGSTSEQYEPIGLTKEALLEWTEYINQDSGFLVGGRLMIFNDVENVGRATSAAAKALRRFLDAVVAKNQKVVAGGGRRADQWLVIMTTNIVIESDLNKLIGGDGRAVTDRCVKLHFHPAKKEEVIELLKNEVLVGFGLSEAVIELAATRCGGSFRNAILLAQSLKRHELRGGRLDGDIGMDYLGQAMSVFLRQLNEATQQIDELKRTAVWEDENQRRLLVEFGQHVTDCQEWLGQIADLRIQAVKSGDWHQQFEELSKRLSPRYTLGSMMRTFQKTKRDSKWASTAAKKKHAKRRKGQNTETVSPQLDLDSIY